MKKYNIHVGFTDMLFNILLGFFILFMLALMLVNPKKKAQEKTLKLKSNIVATIEWPPGSAADIDIFVGLPSGKVVYFGKREADGAALDRDDRGTKNDKIRNPDGSFTIIRENWENVFIRKMFPGEYIFNVVLYHKPNSKIINIRRPEKTPVKVKIQRFRPHQLIYQKRVFLKDSMEEKTIIRFKVDKKGRIKDKSELFESLLQKTRQGGSQL